jgi:hypothetical protein
MKSLICHYEDIRFDPQGNWVRSLKREETQSHFPLGRFYWMQTAKAERLLLSPRAWLCNSLCPSGELRIKRDCSCLCQETGIYGHLLHVNITAGGKDGKKNYWKAKMNYFLSSFNNQRSGPLKYIISFSIQKEVLLVNPIYFFYGGTCSLRLSPGSQR